jgi:hypothetical protein
VKVGVMVGVIEGVGVELGVGVLVGFGVVLGCVVGRSSVGEVFASPAHAAKGIEIIIRAVDLMDFFIPQAWTKNPPRKQKNLASSTIA